MKYMVFDSPIKTGKGDEVVWEFDDKEKAIEFAKNEYRVLCKSGDIKHRHVYVLDSVDPDPEGEYHFDGDVLWDDQFPRYRVVDRERPNDSAHEFKTLDEVKNFFDNGSDDEALYDFHDKILNARDYLDINKILDENKYENTSYQVEELW